MTPDAADLAQQVLARVGAFLHRLPAEQLADLAAGRLHLSVVAAAPPETPRPSTDTPAGVPEVTSILTTLAGAVDRASARQLLDRRRLSVAQLRALARAGGIAVPARATRSQLRDTVVQWTVGRRVDAAVLGGS